MTDQKTLMAVCGHMDQIAGVRQMEFQDGRAAGLRCAMIHNGPLELPLMLDKCLDPAWIRYKGINLSLLTKPGLQGRNPYDTAGDEAVRSIMGGAMFTCGLGNVHGNRVVDGVEYPVHGRMRTTPAEKISMDAFWENGEYKILVSGEMREAQIFGENLVLRRTIETTYGSREIVFTDEIENQGFEDQPLCFLYHCNAGYPFLVPGLRVVMPSIFCGREMRTQRQARRPGTSWRSRWSMRRSRYSSMSWQRIVMEIRLRHLSMTSCRLGSAFVLKNL